MIKRFLRNILNAFGYDIHRSRRLDLGSFLDHIVERGFQPRTVLDVGVGEGTRQLYTRFPEARLVLVEPLQEFQDDLERIEREYGAEYMLAAAGSESGEREINVRREQLEGSTFFEDQGAVDRDFTVDARNVPVTTLDRVSEEFQLEGPYLIKIDVQGAELEVLRGASNVLRDTEVIVLEVQLFEFFDGAPLFDDVISFMKDRGYVVYDFLGKITRPIDDAVAQVNVAFVREEGPFRRHNHFVDPAGGTGSSSDDDP